MGEIINFTEINSSIINDCLMLEKLLKNEGLGKLLRTNTQIVDEMIKELTFEIQDYFTQALIILKDINSFNENKVINQLINSYKSAFNNFLDGNLNLVKKEINKYKKIIINIDQSSVTQNNYI